MVTRLLLISQSLASADTVARLTGYKYQPAEVQSVLEPASGIVEAIAGWGRAARRGLYLISEQAPLGPVWTLPIYPVRSITAVRRAGIDVTADARLENDCQIRYETWDWERLQETSLTVEAEVEAGYDQNEAPTNILLAVAVAADMILSQTSIGPRELSVPGLKISLPTIAEAIKGVIDAS